MQKVLVHLCCGPCSIIPIQKLKNEGYSVTGYFANPNIHPLSEYLQRRQATQEAVEKLHVPIIWQDDVYDIKKWLAAVYEKNIADNTNGLRCLFCYQNRLELTQKAASENNFDFFTTSLLYSTMQKHTKIIQAGQAAEVLPGPRFLYEDFRSGWQQGIEQSKTWGLYRQNYCACIFSEEERFQKKLQSKQKATLPLI